MPKRVYSFFKKIVKKRWIYPILLFSGYVALYFLLRDSFLFTPDFGGTDVFHFNISYKYHLWQSIRSGIIPFWTDMLDGGFPLVAESQMGTFFLPYYFIFPFFSNFSHAYAFLFSFHLFLLSIGMYLLLRELKIPSFLSFLLTIIFAWNGSITFRWVHFIVLQSFSFTPLLFWIYFKWNKSQMKIYLLLMALLINQMVFAGFIQVVFISLLGLIILFVIQNFPLNRNKTCALVCTLFIGMLLSFPQILPTLQLSQFTGRTLSSSYEFAVSIPFNMQNICAFYSEDCMGTAQKATYSKNFQVDGVFWENTPYLGKLFAILVIISTIYMLLIRRKIKMPLLFLGLFLLFLLLALGKNSPLYFIFSIFPFSMFRTPPRYLLIAVFFLVIYTGLVLKEVMNRKTYITIFVYLALIFNCVILIRTAFMYHVFVDSSELYKSLSTQKKVKPNSLYIAYGSSEVWNNIILKQGWSSKKNVDKLLFINRALLPNTNLISGQSSFNIYASLEMRRQQYIKSLLYDGLEVATHQSIEATESAGVENMLKLYNVGSIISLKRLFLPHFKETQVMKKDGIGIITYQRTIEPTSNVYYVPETVKKVNSMEELQDLISGNHITKEKSVGELIPSSIVQNPSQVRLAVQKNTDGYLSGMSVSQNSTFVVLNKNWYPEWKLTIDGKVQNIYKTNIIHIGFFVPKGKHTFELKYAPTSFYLGCVVSFLTVVIGVVGITLSKAIKGGK